MIQELSYPNTIVMFPYLTKLKSKKKCKRRIRRSQKDVMFILSLRIKSTWMSFIMRI